MDFEDLPASENYFTNEDGTVRVPAFDELDDAEANAKKFKAIKKCWEEYKWRDGKDFLLNTFPKNGKISKLVTLSALV